jgi:drug/metabolite transporter (DMT)-like permease
LTLTSASKSGFITGTLVVMVPFLAKPILGSPLKSRQLLAALMSLTGVYFLNPNKIDNINPGDILTLFCALAFALHLVYLQKFSRIEISLPLTLFQIVMVAMLALPLGIFAEGLRGIDSWKVWGLAVYLALFCTALAYWIQTRFQPQTQPHTAAVIYMLEPVFAAFFAYLILSEAPPNLLGAGLILVSMMIAEW